MPSITTSLEEIENKLNRKFHSNRIRVGISILPGTKHDTFRLAVVGRPPSQHGNRQGDHTFALCAIYRALEWQFENVTLLTAIQKVKDFHRILCMKFACSFALCHDLMDLAEKAHNIITSRECSNELVCPWICEYLTLCIYIQNFLPEAAIVLDKGSGNQGEGAALEKLKEFETRTVAGQKEEIVKGFSALFDKNAVRKFIDKDRSEKEYSVIYLLLAFHNLLQGVPKLSKILLGENSILSLGELNNIDEDVIGHLRDIFFGRETDSAYLTSIRDSLMLISKVKNQLGRYNPHQRIVH